LGVGSNMNADGTIPTTRFHTYGQSKLKPGRTRVTNNDNSATKAQSGLINLNSDAFRDRPFGIPKPFSQWDGNEPPTETFVLTKPENLSGAE
jgi:hypothetical protein